MLLSQVYNKLLIVWIPPSLTLPLMGYLSNDSMCVREIQGKSKTVGRSENIYCGRKDTSCLPNSVKPLLGPVVITQLFCLFLCAIPLCKCQGYAWLGLNKVEVKQGKVALPSLHFAGLRGKPAMCIVWSWHFLSHICTMKMQRHYLSCFKNWKQLWILLYLSDHTALFLWFKRFMESSNFTLSRLDCVKWSLLKHEPLSSQTWLLKHHRRWHDNVTGQVTLIT